MVKQCGWWSRPRNLEPPRASFIDVRPNSPPQITSVCSSKPRCFKFVLVQLAQRVEAAAADVAVHALRVRDVKYRVAGGAALHALVDGRQVAGTPQGLAAGRVGAAADEDDEAGQLLIFGAEAVGD